jgi:hypothetical protein
MAKTPQELEAAMLALLVLLAACASDPDAVPPPDGWSLVYAQDFERPDAAEDLVASDADAWRVTRADKNGYLELFAQSDYQPAHRSPLAVALLVGPVVGDFVLEADLLQTGRDYDHRDLCVFFGVRDPEHYNYVHLATMADDSAHQVHLVDGADRRAVTTARTFGVEWGRDRWHHVRVERDLSRERLRVFFDRSEHPVLEARDVTLGEGWIGLGSFDDVGCFDNVRLWAPRFRVESPGFFEELQVDG